MNERTNMADGQPENMSSLTLSGDQVIITLTNEINVAHNFSTILSVLFYRLELPAAFIDSKLTA